MALLHMKQHEIMAALVGGASLEHGTAGWMLRTNAASADVKIHAKVAASIIPQLTRLPSVPRDRTEAYCLLPAPEPIRVRVRRYECLQAVSDIEEAITCGRQIACRSVAGTTQMLWELFTYSLPDTDSIHDYQSFLAYAHTREGAHLALAFLAQFWTNVGNVDEWIALRERLCGMRVLHRSWKPVGASTERDN